ncbi:LOW QUALITY PROTEIN: hypothetical protein Cgig2_016322 [Carnegiea gigantea]|uniref:Uncharacterized protein n=1 Tax=Carnegiea gigantea TaxID=171969 RepID=A0A9Q1Q586_9CARY|nr:LOW QUALITY PROTEIN: hypothetical protein Cgig2_016322 [Carnegiea gigantea]
MALYVLGNFEWYRMKVSFPPHPLPSDYEELCSDFALAEAEEYAPNYEVPELLQVVFLVMLLNDAMKLGVLRGWMIGLMETALKELWWSTFQTWVGGRILEARRQEALNYSEEEESSGSDDQTPLLVKAGTEKMADHVSETFKWHLRRASRPRRLLPEDYRDLCPNFTLPDAKEAARDFNIPEIV